MVHIIDDRLGMKRVLGIYENHMTRCDFATDSGRRFGAGRAERYAYEHMHKEAAKSGADIIFLEGIEHQKLGFGRYRCITHGKLYRFRFIDD